MNYYKTESNPDSEQSNESKKPDAPKDFKQMNPFKNSGGGKKNKINFYWIYGIIVFALIMMMFFNPKDSSFGTGPVKVERYDALNFIRSGDVDKIIVTNGSKVELFLKKESLPKYEAKLGKENVKNVKGPQFIAEINDSKSFKDDLNEIEKNTPQELKVKYTENREKDWSSEFSWLIFIGITVLIWVFFMRRMGGGGGSQIFNIGKSRATLFDKDTNVKIDFKDVAGLEEAKIEINEIVDFLKNPKKYTELGAKIPKGALLVGPPGTGKTLLAKAVAGEAQVPFFSLSGSDFVEMFVGVGASRVRDLFRQAKEKAPCIVFIDEIDAIGRARGKSLAQGSNDERENTLNQLLTEMDGFGTNSGVIIMAATNRADILDRALLRAGRFDRQIHVELPDLNERNDIFIVHMRNIKVEKSVEVGFLAKQTPGFSGADIANVCNEAALIAARREKKEIEKQDFLDAVDRIIGGLEKRNKLISRDEKKVIAYHEAGHATLSWLLEYAHPLVKVTIIPRGKALGAAWYLPEERQITTAEQLLDEMCALMGGRASEEVIFGKVSTGALNDIERASKQAYAIVAIYGLNERIGNVSYYDSSGQQEYSFGKPYSERTAEVIDEEVKKLVNGTFERAKQILRDNKDKLIQLSEILLDKEVIFSEDLEKIFGERPYALPEERVPAAKSKMLPELNQEEPKVQPELPENTEGIGGVIE